MPASLMRFLLGFVLLAAVARGQSVTLETFDIASPSGIITGTSWARSGNIVRSATTMTVAGNANDDSGWGKLNLDINATGMTHVRVVAQRNAGNVAQSLKVTLRDSALNGHTVAVSASAFAEGSLTTVDIPIGAWPAGFDFAHIGEWDIGGGSPPQGLVAFRMTFDHLSLIGGSPPAAPTITTQPLDRAIGLGTGTYMEVAATSLDAIRYQWKKNGVAISGATNARIEIPSVLLPADGSTFYRYQVDVTNDTGTTPSREARLTVLNAVPVQALAAGKPGYEAGGTVSIANTLTFGGGTSSLRWQVLLPLGWTYASDTGTGGATVRTFTLHGESMVEWIWSALPATSPLRFTYTLNVPIGSERDESIVALITYGQDQVTGDIIGRPDPLVVRNIHSYHSADRNLDLALSVSELTRVIDLYSTRDATGRTGAYAVAAGTTEDGFETAPGRSVDPVALERYHSADSNRDSTIDLLELTRVIELYNFRNGTVRTGQYHVDSSTLDGFDLGPTP